MLRTSDQSSQNIARNVLHGADGFLLEPFSVDVLTEITRLATQIKKDRSRGREKKAVAILVDDVIAHIDLIACMLSFSMNVQNAMKKLREKCIGFNELKAESLDVFFETVAEKFEAAKLPQISSIIKGYVGSSERLRKKFEAKMLAELQKSQSPDSGE